MKLSSLRNKAEKLFIYAFLIYVVKCFYLIVVPDPYPSSQIITGGMAIIAFILFFGLRKYFLVGRFGKHILILLSFIVLQIFISIVRYPDQGMITTVKEALPYFVTLIYFVLLDIFRSENGYEQFIVAISIVSITLCALLVANAIMYNTSKSFFLKIQNVSFGSNIVIHRRNGVLRILNVAEGLVRVSFLISCGVLLSNQIKSKINIILHIINASLCLFTVYFLDQSRAYFLILIISVLIMVIASNRIQRKTISRLVLALTIFIAIVFFRDEIVGVLRSLFRTLSDNSDAGNWKRVAAVQFFLDKALYNPLFGNGFERIIYGSSNYYYSYEDVGIIGQIGKLGFPIFIWYTYLIIRLYKIVKGKDKKVIILNLGLFVSLLLSSFTLIYLDNHRIVAFPITIAIMEHLYNLSTIKEKK